MRIHKAGYKIILASILIIGIGNILMYKFSSNIYGKISFIILSCIIVSGIVYFFRNPRQYYYTPLQEGVLAPADGRIVAIEETYESEYFKENRILIAIFMTPLNVHVNWYPINGKVVYSTHHSGRYQAAFLPKSSTENERSTIVIESDHKHTPVLLRQIAGAMARRIVTYAQPGDKAIINKHLGFIKFGSRVDLYLPLDSEIKVKLNQKVIGNQTIIAKTP